MDQHLFDHKLTEMTGERRPVRGAFFRGCLVGSMVGGAFSPIAAVGLATLRQLAPYLPHDPLLNLLVVCHTADLG